MKANIYFYRSIEPEDVDPEIHEELMVVSEGPGGGVIEEVYILLDEREVEVDRIDEELDDLELEFLDDEHFQYPENLGREEQVRRVREHGAVLGPLTEVDTPTVPLLH